MYNSGIAYLYVLYGIMVIEITVHSNYSANVLFSSFCHLDKYFNTLRPRRSEHHFADDIVKRIFFNENVWISINISLKFVPEGPINNIPALVQIMAWRRSGDKPLSEPMMVSLLTHRCVTRPQWVKTHSICCAGSKFMASGNNSPRPQYLKCTGVVLLISKYFYPNTKWLFSN